MRKQWIYGAATGILTAVLFTGCGDGSAQDQDMRIDVLEPVALVGTSEPEEGQSAEEPDGTAAPAQGEGGTQSSAAGEPGAEIEAAVLENLKDLRQNLELPEYVGEAIHLVSSDEWFAAVAGRLYEGCRSYAIGGGEEASLSVQVGYDIEEKPYVNACYQAGGQILVLKYAKDVVWLLQTGIAGGAYDGAFEKWKIDGGAGHILKETGTYANGVIVGVYTRSEYTGNAGELFDLWTNRENFAYKTTEMTYNNQGEIAATPSAAPVATQKPAATKVPAQTAAPTPVPTAAPPQVTAEPPRPTEVPFEPTEVPPQPTAAPPQPTEVPPQPTEAPTAEPVPEPTPTPAGGDTDIEWSPDMM